MHTFGENDVLGGRFRGLNAVVIPEASRVLPSGPSFSLVSHSGFAGGNPGKLTWGRNPPGSRDKRASRVLGVTVLGLTVTSTGTLWKQLHISAGTYIINELRTREVSDTTDSKTEDGVGEERASEVKVLKALCPPLQLRTSLLGGWPCG